MYITAQAALLHVCWSSRLHEHCGAGMTLDVCCGAGCRCRVLKAASSGPACALREVLMCSSCEQAMSALLHHGLCLVHALNTCPQ